MRKDERVHFTHVETEEEFDVSKITEIEELFVDILFEAWLTVRGFKNNQSDEFIQKKAETA